MTNGFKRMGRSNSLPMAIVFGLLAVVVFMICGAMLLALLIVTERVGEDAIGWGCMVILPLSSALGSLCAWLLLKRQRLMVTGITAGGFYILLLILALPFGGLYDGMGITALLVALGGGIALIPALLGSGSGVHGHKNRRMVKLHKK